MQLESIRKWDDETECWEYRNSSGLLHRLGDRPAVSCKGGNREYWVNGKLHRDGDKPCTITEMGSKKWAIHGRKIRVDDKPAYVGFDGSLLWYHDNGLIRKRMLRWGNIVTVKEYDENNNEIVKRNLSQKEIEEFNEYYEEAMKYA